MTDYELDNMFPSEDPFYLDKKTIVFCMMDPVLNSEQQRVKTFVQSYNRYGYMDIRFQYKRPAGLIGSENDRRGYDLHFDKKSVSIAQAVEWYTFVDIIRKIRVLPKPVIIADVKTQLVKDIKLTIVEKPFDIEFFGVGGDEQDRNILIPTAGMLIAPKYAESLMEFVTKHRINGSVNSILMNHYFRKIAPANRVKHSYAKVL